jgi:hypothetical protein
MNVRVPAVCVASSHQFLTEEFRRTHRVGRVDRFITAGEDDTFDTRINCRVDDILEPEGICFHSFERIVLTDVDVFHCGRMDHNIDVFHCTRETVFIAHIATKKPTPVAIQ